MGLKRSVSTIECLIAVRNYALVCLFSEVRVKRFYLKLPVNLRVVKGETH